MCLDEGGNLSLQEHPKYPNDFFQKIDQPLSEVLCDVKLKVMLNNREKRERLNFNPKPKLEVDAKAFIQIVR